MASRRLNNTLRSSILNKLVERTFPARYAEIDMQLGKWLVDYHKAWHKGYEAVLDQLPDRAAMQIIALQVRQGSRSKYSDVITISSEYALKSFHDFPSGYEYQDDLDTKLVRATGKKTLATDTLATKLDQLLKARKKIAEDEGTMRNDARALLDSVQTYKALLEVWPEVAEVIGTDEAPKPQRALVKNLGALNAAFQLGTPKSLLKKKK